VSRIDQALQRAVGGETITFGSQQLFKPAWADTASEPDPTLALPTIETRPGQVPRVLPAVPTGLVRFSSQWRERLAGGSESDPALVEQFRRLAATLHHAQQANGLRSVMVTSAAPGDGKTLTAINLAIVLAESYRYNVLLVDADLRRPSISGIVEHTDGSGLSEALRAQTEQKLALVPIAPRLTLLPAGQATANSIEALTSPRMRQILEEALGRFDWVILDAPPVGPTADANLLSRMVGGALFVIHAGRTQYHDVEACIKGLGREQIIGVVLNAVVDAPAQDYYYAGGKQA
jgi:capsular exopolysaccharide synthesis family protein